MAEEVFDEMWRALRSALVYELRRSGLWTSPPTYLGICGWPGWQAGAGDGRAGNALEELLVDCYSYVFIQRLPRLRSQLAVKPRIDGLVFLFLRNYIHERRKAHDPLGFKIYKTLSAAVRQAIDAGELAIVAGDAKIRNPSVLAFRAGEDPRRAAAAAVIEPIVRQWCDELLPELVTAIGGERRELIGKLRRRMYGLAAQGVRVFRFKDVVDPLKRGVRARWATFFELAEHAEARPEETDEFDGLTGRVAARLERLDVSPKTRRYLDRLWGFLRRYATDSRCDDLPSNRRLAALLHIPRERLPGLYATLRGVIAREQGSPEPPAGAPVVPRERSRRSARRRPARAYGGVGFAPPAPTSGGAPATLGLSP